MSRRDKILGSLIGGAVGDAMGSVTEARTTEAILQRHGGYVRELRKAPPDTFSRINERGAVTDDFSLVYLEAKAFINHKGVVNRKLFEEVLIEWSDLPQYFIQAGPNSRDQILRLKGVLKDSPKSNLRTRNDLVTNGTAMKASPIGMINPGDLDGTITETIYMCMPTHPTTLAISGGAAISCAVAQAMVDGATKEDVINAGLYGAREGYERAKAVAYPASGAKIERRIQMAVEIAVKYAKDYERLLYEIASLVGTGYSCAESAAAVFGFFLVAKDPLDLIIMGTNAGADADSVGTMGGAIYGALVGSSAFDPEYQKIIEENNFWDKEKKKHFDLNWLADGLDRVVQERSAK